MADIKIYGTLKNETPEGVIAKSDQIKDDLQDKFQEEINSELIQKINQIEGELEGGLIEVDDKLSETSINPVQNKVVTKALGGKLSKTSEDSTRFLLKLLGGAEFGDFSEGLKGGKIDSSGLAEFLDLVLRGALKSSNFVEGRSGYCVKNSSGEGSYLEVDKLFVRKTATFVELLIQQIKHVGGQIVLSPASVICSKVEDSGANWRCYFQKDQGDKSYVNEFEAGDLVRCQTFNLRSEGGSNQNYWRLVTGVGENYVDLSKTDCMNGSTNPREGDNLVLLGSKTNPDRQSAIVLSSYGLDAPYIKLYRGINSYSLEGKEIISFSKKEVMIIADTIRLKSGSNLGDDISNISGKLDQAIQDLTSNIVLIDQLKTILGEVKDQTDGSVELWYFNPQPSSTNQPEVDWTTVDLRESHLSDLYYSSDLDKVYKYTKSGSSYSWVEVTSTDLKNAVKDVRNSPDIADDHKRRIFSDTPKQSGEYDKGDLWADASYPGKYENTLLRCITKKSPGEAFSIDHWELGCKYTDDTTANKAIESAAKAQQAAENAEKVAQQAEDKLKKWAEDGVISPLEKPALKDEIARIDSDKSQIEKGYREYDSLGEPSEYLAAHTQYRDSLVKLSADEPENIPIPDEFAVIQSNYYDRRSIALNAIAAAAKGYANSIVSEVVDDLENYKKEVTTKFEQTEESISLSVESSKKYTDGQVKTLNTSITALDGKISLKADSSTVDDLTERVEGAEIALEPDNIWLSVSKKVSDSIAAAKIGNRNYILGTSKKVSSVGNNTPNQVINTEWTLRKQILDLDEVVVGVLVSIKEGTTLTGESKISIKTLDSAGWGGFTLIETSGQLVVGDKVFTKVLSKAKLPKGTGDVGLQVVLSNIQGGTVTIGELRCYEGNNDPGWAPAPEDGILATEEIRAELEIQAGLIAGKVEQTEYDKFKKTTNDALLELTPEKISAVVKEEVTSQVGESISSIESRLDIAEGQISSSITKIDSLGGKVTEVENKMTTEGIWSLVSNKVLEEVDSVYLDNTNRLKNTRLDLPGNTTEDRGSHKSSIDTSNKYLDTNSLKVTTTSNGDSTTNNVYWKSWTENSFSASSNVVSFYAKASNVGVKLSSRVEHGYSNIAEVTLTTDWKKYEVSINSKNTWSGWVFWISQKDTTVWICLPKLEVGNKSTPWSPAPEDTRNVISSMQSSITQLDSKILAKVDKTEYEEFKNITNTSLAKLTPEQIWLSVSGNVINEIDKIQVGGTNLLTNSSLNDGKKDSWEVSSKASVDTSKKYQGRNSFKIEVSGSSSSLYTGVEQKNTEYLVAKEGDEFVVSIYSFSDNYVGIDSGAAMEIRYYNSGGSGIKKSVVSINPNTNNIWKKFSVSGKCPKDTAKVGFFAYVTRNGRIWINGMKLERGTKATEWSPSPQDTNIAISATNANLKILEDSITSLATKEEVSTINGNINKLTSRVSTAESKITPEAINLTVKSQTQTLTKLQNASPDPNFEDENFADLFNYGSRVPASQAPSGCPTKYCAKSTSRDIQCKSKFTVIQGSKLYVTAYINTSKAKHPCSIGIAFWKPDGTNDNWAFAGIVQPGGSGWTRAAGYVTVPTASNSYYTHATLLLHQEGNSGFGEAYFTSVEISEAKGAVEEVKAGMTITDKGFNFFGKEFNFSGKVSIGDLDKTVIENGKIKTELIDANSIVAKKVETDPGKGVKTAINSYGIDMIYLGESLFKQGPSGDGNYIQSSYKEYSVNRTLSISSRGIHTVNFDASDKPEVSISTFYDGSTNKIGVQLSRNYLLFERPRILWIAKIDGAGRVIRRYGNYKSIKVYRTEPGWYKVVHNLNTDDYYIQLSVCNPGRVASAGVEGVSRNDFVYSCYESHTGQKYDAECYVTIVYNPPIYGDA